MSVPNVWRSHLLCGFPSLRSFSSLFVIILFILRARELFVLFVSLFIIIITIIIIFISITKPQSSDYTYLVLSAFLLLRIPEYVLVVNVCERGLELTGIGEIKSSTLKLPAWILVKWKDTLIVNLFTILQNGAEFEMTPRLRRYSASFILKTIFKEYNEQSSTPRRKCLNIDEWNFDKFLDGFQLNPRGWFILSSRSQIHRRTFRTPSSKSVG